MVSKQKRARNFTLRLRKALLLVTSLLATKCHGALTDPSLSTIQLDNSGMAGVANTVTVTTVDVNGVAQTTGGEEVVLRVEHACTLVNALTCTPLLPTGTASTIPQNIPMTDLNNGQYSAQYTVSAGSGTLSVSAIIKNQDELLGQYWTNTNWSGSPTVEQFEQNIDYEWSTGNVGPLSQADNVSARWQGIIFPTVSDTYTLYGRCNNQGSLIFEGVTQTCYTTLLGSQEATITKLMIAGQSYPFTFEFFEQTNWASANLKWQRSGFSKAAIPAEYFQSQERIGGAVHSVVITPSSVPVQSTLESAPSTTIAGEQYLATFQSRDSLGTAHSVSDDTYTVEITQSDGLGSEQETATGVHTSAGIYQATFSPTVAGTYTLTADLQNQFTAQDSSISLTVGNTPSTLTVKPGEIDPDQCFSDVPTPTIPYQKAALPFNIVISFVDLWGNHHYETLTDEVSSGMQVEAIATYINHDEWSSPIGAQDDPDWQTNYGTEHIVNLSDNNDGTMSGQLTIERAGTYLLEVKVDDEHIQNSPHSFFNVEPDSISGPDSVLALELVDEEPASEILIYAGFDYQFQIQGRDQYQNNVKDFLTSLSGVTSAQLTKATNTIEASVSDDPIGAGVYQVAVTLAKSEPEGDYIFNVQLDGTTLTTPPVRVLPCSNFVAAEKEIIQALDPTQIVFNEIEYTIGDELLAIELAPVEFYCKHTPIQVLLTATAYATSTGANTFELTHEELQSRGITIHQPLNGGVPLLSIQTDDQDLNDLTFDLVISSTVVEEQAWQRNQTLTIKYLFFPEEFNPESIYVSEEAPRFDAESTSKDTLQMKVSEETEEEPQFLPIVFSCNQDSWEKSLPAIVDEGITDNKFTVSVKLGEADKLISYSPTQRKFKLLPFPSEREELYATIYIDLSNSSGKTFRYELAVRYFCPMVAVSKPLSNKIEQVRIDTDPPLPSILSISPIGEVVVRFSQTMLPLTAVNVTEASDKNPERFRALSTSDASSVNSGVTVGLPTGDFKNFMLLHNHTVYINETAFPSVQISIVPDDPEDPCSDKLAFTWETSSYSDREWALMLHFDSPACVSASSLKGDTLSVTFYDQRLFMDTRGKVLPPELTITKRIVRQLAQSDKAVVDSVNTGARVMLAGSLFNVIINLLMQASITQLVGALKNLQIIVHILLIQLYMAPHAAAFLQELQKMISFDLYDPSEISQEVFDATEGDSIDINFESVGYENSDFILNLGAPFFVVLGAPVLFLFLFLLYKCSCCGPVKRFAQRRFRGIFFNGIITFTDGIFLIGVVCFLIQFYQVEKGVSSPNTSYYFAMAFMVSIVVYLIVLLSFLNRRFVHLKNPGLRERVGSAYEGYDLAKAGRLVVVAVALSYGRRLALSLIVTYGRNSTESQRFYMNFGSVFMLIFVGYVRPHTSKHENWLELINEYTILILYCHCITQTDFVTHFEGRHFMGWSLIGVISLNILINFSTIAIIDLHKACRKLKFWYIRRRKKLVLAKKQAERRLALIEAVELRNIANMSCYKTGPLSEPPVTVVSKPIEPQVVVESFDLGSTLKPKVLKSTAALQPPTAMPSPKQKPVRVPIVLRKGDSSKAAISWTYRVEEAPQPMPQQKPDTLIPVKTQKQRHTIVLKRANLQVADQNGKIPIRDQEAAKQEAPRLPKIMLDNFDKVYSAYFKKEL